MNRNGDSGFIGSFCAFSSVGPGRTPDSPGRSLKRLKHFPLAVPCIFSASRMMLENADRCATHGSPVFATRHGGHLQKSECGSGLRCPAFASGVVAPLQKTDRCPCSASAAQPTTASCFVHWTRLSPCLASYRAAGTNVRNAPEHNGPAEVSETRKVYGTQ